MEWPLTSELGSGQPSNAGEEHSGQRAQEVQRP